MLFVTDTSGSMDEERKVIAHEIDSFSRALDENVDMRIAVMLAHGSSSYWSGRLYQDHKEPVVLSVNELKWNKTRDYLREKVSKQPSDYMTDGGEVGLTSLNRALDADRLQEAQSLGFFREDAALVVIFVSDENDICAIYPPGIVPAPDPDRLEAPAKQRECNRSFRNSDPPEWVTPELTLSRLRTLKKSMPLVVSAAVYSDLNTVVHSGENELGYGYLEIVELAHGHPIDLALRDYGRALYELGAVTQNKLDLQHDFSLSKSPVDADSIRVDVDRVPAVFSYFDGAQVVHVEQAGTSESIIEIRYCLKGSDSIPVPTPEPTPAPTPAINSGDNEIDDVEPIPGPTAAPTPTPVDPCGPRGCEGTGV